MANFFKVRSGWFVLGKIEFWSCKVRYYCVRAIFGRFSRLRNVCLGKLRVC